MKRLLALVVLGVALVGCGDGRREPLSRSGEEDAEQLRKYFAEIKDVRDVNARIAREFRDGDLDAAKWPIADLHRAARNAQAIARRIDDEKLRTYLSRYAGAMDELADDYQAYIYAPDDTSEAEFKRLDRTFVKDTKRLAKLDGQLLGVLEEVLTAESYRGLRERIKAG